MKQERVRRGEEAERRGEEKGEGAELEVDLVLIGVVLLQLR